MIRRLENADNEYLQENLNSDFTKKCKQGKIHVIDSYCELTVRKKNITLTSDTREQIDLELAEILLFSKINNFEEYLNEYEQGSDLYAETINKYLHTGSWKSWNRATVEKSTLDLIGENLLGKAAIAIGGAILIGLLRKSGKISYLLLKDNLKDPGPPQIFILLPLYAGVVWLLYYIFNLFFKIISALFISSREDLSQKLEKQPDLIKYLPKKWLLDKDDIVFILINHMKSQRYSAYKELINYIPQKCYKDKDVMLILLSIEHYSNEPYKEIMSKLDQTILDDKNFIIKAVYRNWRIYEYLPEKYRNDEDVAWSLIKNIKLSCGWIKIPDSIFSSKENILRLFEYEKDHWNGDKLLFNSQFLKRIPDEYKKDRDFLKLVLTLNGDNFKYVHPDLRNDYELLEIAKSSKEPFGKWD
jgi:hypothetical protein